MNEMTTPCVTAAQLRAALLERRYHDMLRQDDVFPSASNWEYIISQRMATLGAQLMERYLVAVLTPERDRTEAYKAAVEAFPNYIDALDYDDAVEAVYSGMDTRPDVTLGLIEDHNLFNAPRTLDMLRKGYLEDVVALLSAVKRTYSVADLEEMRTLLDALRHLPEEGRVGPVKLMFKTQTAYVCPEGHINPPSEVFCRTCGRDIHGLTQEHLEAIENFQITVDVLEDMLRRRGNINFA